MKKLYSDILRYYYEMNKTVFVTPFSVNMHDWLIHSKNSLFCESNITILANLKRKAPIILLTIIDNSH